MGEAIEVKDSLFLTVMPSPFTQERITKIIAAGKTIAEIVSCEIKTPSIFSFCHVYVGGHYVPQNIWHVVRVKTAQNIVLRMVPQGGGGGGKNPLRSILSLALMAAAPGIGAAFAGSLGIAGGGVWLGSTFIGAGQILGGVVSMVGRMAINALAPPPRQRGALATVADKPTQFIQGARNQSLKFGRIPKVLGRMRMVPPYAARPFTETVGDDQYVRMLFCLGYGPVEVSDLRFGETPLSQFSDVETVIRQGYEDDEAISLYSDGNSIVQNDLNVLLSQTAGWQVRRTETNVNEISVDITFANGLVQFDSQGNKQNMTVQVEVQYAPAGTNNWSAGSDTFLSVASTVSPALSKPDALNGARRAIVHRVYLDPFNGDVGVVTGDITLDGLEDLSIPALPADMLACARVVRYSDDADVIDAGRITDERAASLVGSVYQASGDFLPSTSTTAHVIDIDAGGLKNGGLTITARQTSALRRFFRFSVAQGQYDVRIRRKTTDTDTTQIFDKVYWTALRSIRHISPVQMSGLGLIAIRIKATDQLNGAPDQFNCIVQSILPDWDADTETWIERPTSNPASQYRYVLQGTANKRPLPDSRLIISDLEIWHNDCVSSGYQYDAVIDSDTTVGEILAEVASAGRAAPARPDGRWTVVQDKLQTVPRQHFTPRNTSGFRGERSYPELPHAFRVRFQNRDNGWEADERIVYDDGYSEFGEVPGTVPATKFETLDLSGVTSPDQAWKAGRYHIATVRLRPENYTFTADVEHIVCTKGDLIKFSHDVTLHGLGSGRIKAMGTSGSNITSITSDEAFFMQAGKNYGVVIRLADGTSLQKNIVTAAGEQKTLVFVTPFPVSGGCTVGDLFSFGERGSETVDLIVKSIQPSGDLTATITCVDAAPQVHQADTGTIPAFNSQVTTPPEFQRPSTPVLVTIQSNEDVMIAGSNGAFIPAIVLTLEPHGFPLPLVTSVRIKASAETQFIAASTAQAGNQVTITGIDTSQIYDIEVTYKQNSGVNSAALLISAYQVIGASGPPDDVENFRVNILGQTAYLAWDEVNDIDLAYYRIKYSPALTGAAWESSVDLVAQVSKTSTTITVPAISGTYLIKAVDLGGRESINAALIISDIDVITGFNAVQTVTENPTFTGAKSGVVLSGGGLQLAGADTVDSWASWDDVANIDIGLSGLLTNGTYSFAGTVDLTAVYTSRLTASITATGIDINNTVDSWPLWDSIENIDGGIDPSSWSVTLQLRTTLDNPSGSPTWTAWQDFIVGDYTARGFEFRLLLRSLVSGVTPFVDGLSVTVDMPDRVEAQDNLTSNASDSPTTAVTFPVAFKAKPAVAVTAQAMATGDYLAITNQTSTGFEIVFRNAAGTRVTRTFDYVAKGFGAEQ